jgi:large subunit ribosomal protein L29
MEMHDIEKKTDEELNGLVRELKAEMHDLQFQSANGQLKQVRRIRNIRKDIARIKTVLSARHKSNLNQQTQHA